MPTTSELPDEIAVRCDGLSKVYNLGEELSLQKTLQTLIGRNRRVENGLRALDDVTFEVHRGDRFGIVGSNGSGKSTLTQIISGIAVPTRGTVQVRGRVLPLLEVGAGFHSDLTGRENVILLGTVLGLQIKDIRASLPRIEEFSGITRHLDTPLKRYSSGMQARLSFSTAMCFPADVYIFDEVLAVVDDDFRDQCLQELIALNAAGRTVIFMSHDLDLVRALCKVGMWLDKGVVRKVGDMGEVADAYAAGQPAAAAA